MDPSVARSEKVMALISDRLGGGEDLYDGILETYENTCGEKVDLNDPASLQNFEQTVQGYFGSVILPSNLDLKAIKSQFRVEFLRDGEDCPNQERLKLRNELASGFEKLFDELWQLDEEKRDFVVKNLGGSKLVTAASFLETDLTDLYSVQIRNSDIEVLRDLLGIIHDPVKRPIGLKLLQILGYGLINSHGRHSADYTNADYLEQSYIKAVEMVKGLEIKEDLGDKEIKEILAASTAEELLKKIEPISPPEPSGGGVVDLITRAYEEVISILRPNLNPGFDTVDPMTPYVKVRMFEDALKLANQEQSDRLRSAVSFMSNSKIVEIFRKAYDDFEYEFIDRLIPAYANLLSEVSVNDAGVFMKTAFENASKQYHVLHQSRFYMDFYLLRIAEKLGTLNADVMAAWKASLHFTGGLIHDWASIVMSFENDLDLGWSDSSVNKEISQVAGSVNLITGIRRSAAEARGVKLEVGKLQTDVPPLPPNMRAAFFRIANEFIINGIKYSDKGKANRYMRVRFETEDSILRIFFEDNGVGIPDEKREDIWKEGVRLSPELADGDGLGLPNIHSLADEHGWKVDLVKSAPGVGSVFMLEMDTSKWEKGAASGSAQTEGGTEPPATPAPAPSGSSAVSKSPISKAQLAAAVAAAEKGSYATYETPMSGVEIFGTQVYGAAAVFAP